MASTNPQGTPQSPMGIFLHHCRKILQQYRGANDTSLGMIAALAAQKEVSREEMASAGAQLGLTADQVDQVINEAGLKRERSGSASPLVMLAVLSVILFLGAGAAIVFYPYFLGDSGETT